ncbi:MAG: hypothetical protein AAF633_25150 [Chloroflexota bacterium]
MQNLSRTILKTHAVFLWILTVVLTLTGFIGLNTGTGPYNWLNANPMVLVGLMQAYLLMFVVGVALWIGAEGERLWRWSVVAIIAHCIPLLTIASLWDVLAAGGFLGLTAYSYVIHGSWILVEVLSLWLFVRNQNNRSSIAPGI